MKQDSDGSVVFRMMWKNVIVCCLGGRQTPLMRMDSGIARHGLLPIKMAEALWWMWQTSRTGYRCYKDFRGDIVD